jgi:hypothetical protein
MTLDLGALALSRMRVEGWGEQVRHVRAGWRWPSASSRSWASAGRSIRNGQNSWYTVLSDLSL